MSDENAANPKRRGLGRGLNALFEDQDERDDLGSSAPDQGGDAAGSGAGAGQKTVPIEFLEPNPHQPRHHFDPEALKDLMDSIKVHGILQPILVRPKGYDLGKYEIIAGERRWRAAQMAQLFEVPVVVQQFTDTEALEVALVENLQRKDLDPIEEALGYQQLQEQFGHKQDQIASVVGKSRSHVANMLRLLTLPDSVKDHVSNGTLSAGHARTLIGADNPEKLAKIIIDRGLSVRQAEMLASGKEENENRIEHSPVTATGKSGDSASGKASTPKNEKDVDTLALEKELSDMLGMAVTIESNNDYKTGHVEVHFKSLDQLDEILARLSNVSNTTRLMQ